MTPRPIMAILDKVESRKDNTWMIRIATNELGDEDILHLNKNVNKQGYFFFEEAPFTNVVIPQVQLGEFETKTPSQRMHNVIYRLWEKSDKSKDSEAYYKYTMEKIIDQLKEKLN